MGFFWRRSKSPKRAEWTLRGELAAPKGHPELIRVGVGPDGLPVAIWGNGAAADAILERVDLGPDQPSLPRSQPEEPFAVALTRHTQKGALELVAPVADLNVTFPFIQPLPDGGFAVVGARAWWHEEGPEHNAHLYTPEGELRLTGCIGDGIARLQTDGQGRLWAGYFDEGIFGNFGWGGLGPEPLGAAGIVAWSPALEVDYELSAPGSMLADCYALNVAEDAVWACTYINFPVIRIANASATVIPTSGLSGPRVILAHGDRVALFGSYDDPSLCVVGSLTDDHYIEVDRFPSPAVEGRTPGGAAQCRGSVAHAFLQNRWYTLDLADF